MVAGWITAVGSVFVATVAGIAWFLAPVDVSADPTPIAAPAAMPDEPEAAPEVDEDPPYSTREAPPAQAAWTRESGTVPTLDRAMTELEERKDIFIRGKRDLNPDHGIREGDGSWERPYVISGWFLNNLAIYDTDAYIVVKENYVRNQLILNWNGDRVNVHHNYAMDLRVNQNIKRTGDATAGVIADNQFLRVGQIRHYDGEFAHNTVGESYVTPPPNGFLPVAVNVDGFNGARFHDNDIHGILDIRLHGHHHGSGVGMASHHHGKDEARTDESGALVNHSVRHHSIVVENNKVTSHTPYALRYFDRSHAANDRTAASEQNRNLSKPHVHYLQLSIVGNEVRGGAIFLDVLNAADQLHTMGPGKATALVQGNQVTLEAPGDAPSPGSFNAGTHPQAGIFAQIGKSVELEVSGNTIKNEITLLPGQPGTLAGVKIVDMKDATAVVADNAVFDVPYGVWARMLNETVTWHVFRNDFHSVKTPIWWDSSVANPPNEEPPSR